MTPQAASPTALLWAHQLKQEHKFLLQRMQKLEAKSDNQEARIASAEDAAQLGSVHNVERAAAIGTAQLSERVSELESKTAQNLHEKQAESNAISLQVAALQDRQRRAEADQQKAATNDQLLLRQIDEVKGGLQEYEGSLRQMGKRLDEANFDQIKDQLANLAEQVKIHGEQMKHLPENIKALEASNAELKAALKKMAAKAAAAEARNKTVANSSVENTEPHGNGTPGDLEMGKSSFSEAGHLKRKWSNQLQGDSSRNAKQRANGAIDRDRHPIAPSVTEEQPSSSTSKSNSAVQKDDSHDAPAVKPGEVFMRSGKGCLPVVKRGRGRPPKAHITPQFTQEQLSSLGRETRRNRYEPQDYSAAGRRRIGAANGSQSKGGPASKEERDETSIMATASKRAVAEEYIGRAFENSPPAHRSSDTEIGQQAEQRPREPRRQIVQNEDTETFIKNLNKWR